MQDIGVIILAGGKSSRMGEDKGLMVLFGKPMIEYIIDIVDQLSTDIVIVANNEEYSRYDYPIYSDIYPEKGPLGGLHTGLTKSKHEINIVLSCDVPYVKTDLLQFLLSKSKNHDITIPLFEDRTHQLIGIYKKSCLATFEKSIKMDKLKISSIFTQLDVNVVDCNEFDKINFKNLNSKRDISQV